MKAGRLPNGPSSDESGETSIPASVCSAHASAGQRAGPPSVRRHRRRAARWSRRQRLDLSKAAEHHLAQRPNLRVSQFAFTGLTAVSTQAQARLRRRCPESRPAEATEEYSDAQSGASQFSARVLQCAIAVGGVPDDDQRVAVWSKALDVLAFALDAPTLTDRFGEQVGQHLVPYQSGHRRDGSDAALELDGLSADHQARRAGWSAPKLLAIWLVRLLARLNRNDQRTRSSSARYVTAIRAARPETSARRIA